MAGYLVAALYKFVVLSDYRDMQAPLLACCVENQVKGTLLLAEEGINGTIAGPADGVRAVLAYLRNDARLAGLEHKESWASEMPFYRMKVKLKQEIVTMGVPNVHAQTMAGTYVKPENWNALIDDPEVVVVDTRNDYEVAIGTFARAVNPHTNSFTEFPTWVQKESQPGGVLHNKAKVAMFCTGGIRCEKSTAYLRSQGYDEVYHLDGGILKYLETVDQENSRWDGDCFVFDERVSVKHGLVPGDYELCRACRLPLNEADKASEYFVEGVSCPNCHEQHTPEQKERFLERQRQIELARKRDEQHIGEPVEIKKAAYKARQLALNERALAKQKSADQAKLAKK